ncbi:unnamed protein product [Arabidopsis halleri]
MSLRTFMVKAAAAARGGRSVFPRRNFCSSTGNSEGKEVITLADELDRKIMSNFIFGGYLSVGILGCFCREYIALAAILREEGDELAQANSEKAKTLTNL